MSTPRHITLVLAVTAAITLGISTASRASAPDKPASAAQPVGEKKLTLIGLDSGVTFTAQQNPQEIQVEKLVPWSKSKTSTSDHPEIQFTSAEGRKLSFDLDFDTSATKTDVHSGYLAKLLALAMVMDPNPNGPEDKKRPSRVKLQWGASALQFEGVIESLEIKYTMFLANGTPVRATCKVKLREASRASFKRPTG